MTPAPRRPSLVSVARSSRSALVVIARTVQAGVGGGLGLVLGGCSSPPASLRLYLATR